MSARDDSGGYGVLNAQPEWGSTCESSNARSCCAGRRTFLLPGGRSDEDAAILSNCPEVQVRRVWVQRIIDHDGDARGGMESWLRLGEAMGVPRPTLGQSTTGRRRSRA